MKIGKLGTLTLAIGSVMLGLFLLRLLIIPSLEESDDNNTQLIRNTSVTSDIPEFSKIADIDKRKEAFFSYLRPFVKRQNSQIKNEREFLKSIVIQLKNNEKLTEADGFRLQQMAEKYQYSTRVADLKSIESLLKRVDIIPAAMVLVQAANESGWGHSRFAREGNNFFGQWCFRKGCGLIPQARDSGLSHEVAVFSSVEASVISYMKNLNTNAAYQHFRALRAQLRAQNKTPDAQTLIYGLLNYSERQGAYIDELLDMLRQNQKFLVDNHEKIPVA